MIRVASILVLVFLASNNINIAESRVLCRGEEKRALLDFKLSFTAHPFSLLSTWSIHDPECCEWYGVGCDDRTGHVVLLDLSFNDLESQQLRPSLLVLQHLTSLDLSGNNFNMRIPEFIGSLAKLTFLGLSCSGFFGKIPPHLGNLTRLQSLWVGDGDSSGLLHADDLQWLSHLSSLKVLDLSGVNLSNATDLVSSLKMLPSLSAFDCSFCSFPLVVPHVSSLRLVNHSTSLHTLDLSYTNVCSLTFSCLINGTNNLNYLNLANMNLAQTNLPKLLGALTDRAAATYALEALNVSGNNLTILPPSVMKFSSLKELDISHNQMNSLPDLSNLSSLTELDASFNRINGNLQAIFNHLPVSLTDLDLSANSLNGVISDAHLSNWVPPFQLNGLKLRSCTLGPHFPNWILTLTNLQSLDISNSSISGAIPSAFWNYSSRLTDLNISNNKIKCTIPNLPLVEEYHATTYLSFNEFHGPIPLFMFSSTSYLDLSNNKFSAFPPFHHEVSNHDIWTINLSNNLLSGSIPNQIFQFDGLGVLNLANNMLSGTIPSNISNLWQLDAFHLNKNRFSGELPSSMKNCTQIRILELGNNNFSKSVPFWLGDSLQKLIVLNLRSNNFSGDLPSNLCHLQRLQVLDLSGNRISGSIPGCIHNFTSMAINKGFTVSYSIIDHMYVVAGDYDSYIDYASIMWKGILAIESSNNLPQRNVIDLSNNHLTGKIPSEVTSLKYLRSLDLSRNNLDGNIPNKIGQLNFLEVLKLSSNRLCGEIPQSLSSMNFLDVLDLSSNNLSGRIPTSTQLQSFDPSSFSGNPELCGEPLVVKCPGDVTKSPPKPNRIDHIEEEANETFDLEAFFAALGTGFAFSFLGILGILHFHACSRHAFFQMATEVGDWVFVKTSLCQSRIKRKLCF